MIENEDGSNHKYVFVCGLARSGTSLLGRNIARLENCTGFKDTGVPEDEGQFLQDVYAVASEYGGSSRVGFDARAHRTETSHLLTTQNIRRLRASWHKHWDDSKQIFVEKTPENLLMTRFLQAAFPNSYFIVIRRHPVPVSMAGQRWKINLTSLHNLFRHWLHCHAIFEEDRKHLRHVYELSYEDYIMDSARYHEEIAAFIGTRVAEPPKEDKFRLITQWRNPTGLRVLEGAMEPTSGAHNQKYFERWRYLVMQSPFKSYYRHIARKYEPRFSKYGYSLVRGMGIDEAVLEEEGKVSAAVGAVACLGTDAGALICRSSLRCKEQLRVTSKAVLPEFVVNRIRQARRRAVRQNENASAS